MGEKRLPQSPKEGFAYGSIICLITVIIMLIINVGTAFGNLGGETWLAILKSIPLIWVVAMALESLLVGRIGNKLVTVFSEPQDGFNAKILFNILFVVTIMSATMSIIGPLLSGESFTQVISEFPAHWPRNFCAAFWCEVLLAQPAARKVMKQWHIHKEKLANE